jgi:GxxExxY protein
VNFGSLSLFNHRFRRLENGLRRLVQNSEYLYADVKKKIIGCAMQVYSHFGMGFPEVVYKRGLLIELEQIELKFVSEAEKDIYYRDKFIGKRRLDLIVEDKVLVEKEVDKGCYNQILNYLKIVKIEVGLLLNFGTTSLEFKRFVHT